jgi:hypothetical protein
MSSQNLQKLNPHYTELEIDHHTKITNSKISIVGDAVSDSEAPELFAKMASNLKKINHSMLQNTKLPNIESAFTDQEKLRIRDEKAPITRRQLNFDTTALIAHGHKDHEKPFSKIGDYLGPAKLAQPRKSYSPDYIAKLYKDSLISN